MRATTARTWAYRRANFSTYLPLEFLYTTSHAWLCRQGGSLWRVGLTKFGVRLLGELVDHGFDVSPQTPVTLGQRLGWLEGFKGVTDIVGVVEGTFDQANPALPDQLTLVNEDPYGAGWLYQARGPRPTQLLNAAAYAQVLDRAIDELLTERDRAT